MYTMQITASTGSFLATFPSADDAVRAANMVQSGAQVQHQVRVEITYQPTKATATYGSRTCLGLGDAVARLVAALASAPGKPPMQGENRDVVVPVRFAVDSEVTLEMAEIWVNQVMTDAITERNNTEERYKEKEAGYFQFNGEPAGQARWDD